MTDSIAVLPPGWRALDNNGRIITQAALHFYDTDGVTPKEVFSDSELTISLGTSVQCNSGGYPVSDAAARVIVYTGSDPYNVQLKDGAGVTVWSHENVRGAVDTSKFLSAVGLVASSPVVGVAASTTRTVDDAGKLFNANTTGGTITTTLPSAVTAGNGFRIGVRHGGAANQHIIASAEGAFVGVAGNTTVSRVVLSQPGEAMWFVSNGTNWHLDTYVPPLRGTTGVILIADRLSSPPGSPQAGARYILDSSPTGAWSSFAKEDIAEYTGAGWFKITPPTDCGWIAYVQDHGHNYQFRNGAWESERATSAIYGTTVIAGATHMENASTGHVVPAHLQHRHPGHPKFWAYVTVSGGTPTLRASYNVSSITDSGLGDIVITLETQFSSANWCAIACCKNDGGGARDVRIHSQTAGTVRVISCNAEGNQTDPTGHNVTGFGDQ